MTKPEYDSEKPFTITREHLTELTDLASGIWQHNMQADIALVYAEVFKVFFNRRATPLHYDVSFAPVSPTVKMETND